MGCLCQCLRSATGKSYKTAITARYGPAEGPSLRTGVLCSFWCKSVGLCPEKQPVIRQIRMARCVQGSFGVGFFGQSGFPVVNFLFCQQMGTIPENGQDSFFLW